MSLEEDARLARLRGLKFEVTRKAARGSRWQTVQTDIDNLEEALLKAKEIDDYESGVFVSFPSERAGFIYWSSRHPDILNDTVLTIEIHYDENGN